MTRPVLFVYLDRIWKISIFNFAMTNCCHLQTERVHCGTAFRLDEFKMLHQRRLYFFTAVHELQQT